MNTFQILLIRTIIILLLVVLLASCDQEEKYLFKMISPAQSGINFSNTITETENFNILNFHYIYNGGGVGIGDFDKNGLPDIVFSGNQVASKLYLNQGNLTFQDITEKSNFNSKGWATGVSIVDINADGWEDIYISVGGLQCDSNCNNQLFIHQGLDKNGVPAFKEMATQYGLADGLYTQQAAFFDYDNDGDLDVYLLHNVIDKRDKNVPSNKRFINEKSKDKLLENNGNGQFIDVSEAMGIVNRGYGLGITINDFNQDNLPDIYIANDFLSDDLLYLNQGWGDGKSLGFKEVGQQKMKHTSYNAMGVDVADVNGDALPDIFVLDMLPAYNERQKTMLGFMNYNKFRLALQQGYSPQFIRNTLQLHNGFLNNELLPFSEIGYLTGIYNTDWSWTPLLADFDNDGDRDLFVTNGYGKDITDLDFINYSQQRNPFGTKATQKQELFEAVQKMSPITMANYIFENQGNLNFKNQQGNWIKKQNSISNGAVYSDLDNDGDLDLVVNNIDEPAFVLENQTASTLQNNFIKINLKGSHQNRAAIGTMIKLWTNGQVQAHYQSPVRGYLSTVDKTCHFGLGKHTIIDSLAITWSNGQIDFLKNIKANQTLNIEFNEQAIQYGPNVSITSYLFNQDTTILKHQHQENIALDFDAQPLLLHQHSRQGPCFAVANIDGKVGDELFIGGAKGFPSQIFYQKTNGQYESKTLSNPEHEDTDAAFFDLDNDGDLDLYVVSGGTEFKDNAPEFQDRIYLNDGKGNFIEMLFSPIQSSGSCVVPNDFDNDGDMDLFVGSRLIPRKYPQAPQSYLLVNEGGKLINKTDEIAPNLKNIGLVSDAIWSDYDKDGQQDLIVIGEWMPIMIFKNQKGQFKTVQTIEYSAGLWNTIEAGDFDGDGDEDYIVGNLGKNSRLQASATEPLVIYNQDYDQNGSIDPLVGQFYLNKAGKKDNYPLHTRDDVMKQLVKFKTRYVKYEDFGKVTFTALMNQDLSTTDFLTIHRLTSTYVENKGNGQFELKALPKAAQYAPIQGVLIDDFDKDGHLDALLSGNDYTSERNNGWYDAFNGLFLKGDGKGSFTAILPAESGFYVPYDGRELVQLKDNKGQGYIIAGQNTGRVGVFKK